MLRDADGQTFFGFCGTKVYVPDDNPNEEGPADSALRIFRERLREDGQDDKPANDRVEGRDAALSRRVPSHDGLAGND